METLYSGMSQRSMELTVIGWALLTGFISDIEPGTEDPEAHDFLYERAWEHLLDNDEYLYDAEQDLDDVWHLTRIYIGEEVCPHSSVFGIEETSFLGSLFQKKIEKPREQTINVSPLFSVTP